MKHDKFATHISVFAIIRDKQRRILLIRRYNTGYLDGFYGLPSGHLEAGETLHVGMLRELLEEVGVTAREKDLKLVHINQNNENSTTPYLNFFFEAKTWSGKAENKEPDKCDDLQWFAEHNLPKKLMPQVKLALEADEGAVSFSYMDGRRN